MQVIPIIAKTCPWPRVGWLSSIQARPRDGKSLESLRGSKVNEALSAIATEILDGLEQGKGADSAEALGCEPAGRTQEQADSNFG
jgi:hypothetical protein